MTKVENAVKDLTSFVKAVKARIEGDKVEELAAKNEIKARSAIHLQIALLSSSEVDAKSALEDAKEAYENAIYPTVLIGDGKAYASGIIRAKEAVEAKEEALKQVEDSLEFYNNLLKERF